MSLRRNFNNQSATKKLNSVSDLPGRARLSGILSELQLRLVWFIYKSVVYEHPICNWSSVISLN
jgi:hypothetical protein